MSGLKSRTQILIVEDHPIVRQGYSQLIGSEPDLNVCGFAASEVEALDVLDSVCPHLAIVDLALKDGHGIALMKRIRERHKHVKLLVISGQDETLFAERSLEAGALGYINKQEALEKLIEGIRCVLAGDVYLSETMSQTLLKYRVGNALNPERGRLSELSNRELEVFQLLGKGCSSKQIARQLNLSPNTVNRHRENIKSKLQISNTTELIHARPNGLLKAAS